MIDASCLRHISRNSLPYDNCKTMTCFWLLAEEPTQHIDWIFTVLFIIEMLCLQLEPGGYGESHKYFVASIDWRVMEELRTQATQKILLGRVKKGITWAALSEELGVPVLWLISAALGEHAFSKGDAEKLAIIFELSDDERTSLGVIPMRGTREVPPSDPTIYRFYEALSVYGGAIKEMIHELFGDGIMSAINFSMDVTKETRSDGDRVVVTMSGKFLPYDWRS